MVECKLVFLISALDSLYEDSGDMEEKRVRYIRKTYEKINDECTSAELDDGTVRAGLEHNLSFVLPSNSSFSCKGRNKPTANKLVPSMAEGSKDFSMAEVATM